MASFQLITQGIEVGYGPTGFSAWGTTDNVRWNDLGSYVPGERLPAVAGEVVYWRIDNNTASQWDQYAYLLSSDQLSRREELLKAFWSEYGWPVARLERNRYQEEGGAAITLVFSLPSDPSLTAFILSASLADRKLILQSGGWNFISEDSLAPAASYTGWTERFEPAFTTDLPMLRMK